jgi:hypothetical protein
MMALPPLILRPRKDVEFLLVEGSEAFLRITIFLQCTIKVCGPHKNFHWPIFLDDI